MKLYMHPVSMTSRPVRLFAAESKIAMDEQVIDLFTGEHMVYLPNRVTGRFKNRPVGGAGQMIAPAATWSRGWRCANTGATIEGRLFKQHKQHSKKNKPWAVVIGIDDYANWPKLQYAVRDARAIRETLVQRFGFSAEHGLQQSPAVGRGLAEWICEGAYTSLDLSPLAAGRLVSGEALVEKNVI